MSKASRPVGLIRLSGELAYSCIDCLWWDGRHDVKRQEEDGEWNWRELVIQYGAEPENDCVCLKEGDTIHGAMVMGVNGESSLVAGTGAVIIHLLAVAPCNRPVTGRPTCCGCGTKLVLYAATQSWNVGNRGAVILHSKKRAEPFYERLGFVPTGRTDEDGLREYELSADVSEKWLQKEGIVP